MKKLLNIFFTTIFLVNTSSIAFSATKKDFLYDVVSNIDNLDLKSDVDFSLSQAFKEIREGNSLRSPVYVNLLYKKIVGNSEVSEQSFKSGIHKSIHKQLTIVLNLAGKRNLSLAQAFDSSILISLFELEDSINKNVKSDQQRIENFYSELRTLVHEAFSKSQLSTKDERNRAINYLSNLVSQLDYSNPITSKAIKKSEKQIKNIRYMMKTVFSIGISLVFTLVGIVASHHFPEYREYLSSAKVIGVVFLLSFLPSLKSVIPMSKFKFSLFVNEFKSKDFSIERFIEKNKLVLAKSKNEQDFYPTKKTLTENFTPLNLEQIKGLLGSEFPVYSGAFEFVNNEHHQFENKEYYNALIESDIDLKQQAEEGKVFREVFLRDLVAQFPDTNIDQIIDPEADLLRRLTQMSVKDFKPQNLTEAQIEKLALARVIDEYMLDANTELVDLMRKSQSDAYFEHIFSEFNKYKFYFHDELRDGLNRSHSDFYEVLKDFKNQTIKLRVLNFRNFINALKAKGLKFINFETVNGKQKIDLSFFGDAQIEFLADRSSGASLEYKPFFIKTMNKGIKQTLSANSALSLDNKFRELYVSSYKPPIDPNALVSFKSRGQSVFLSESDFNQMIYDLSYDFERYSSKDSSRQYQREFYLQDKSSSDFLRLVEGLKKLNLESSVNYLETKINGRKSNEFNFFATGLLDSLKISFKSSSYGRLSDLIWFGYKKHPSYWRYRSVLAEELNLPDVKKSIESREITNEQKHSQLSHAIANLKNRHRSASTQAKALYVASVLAAIYVIVPATIIETVQTVVQSVSIDENKGFEQRTSDANGPKGPGSDSRTDFEKYNQNNSWENSKGKGADKSKLYNVYFITGESGIAPNIPSFFGHFYDYLIPDIDKVERAASYTTDSELERISITSEGNTDRKASHIKVRQFNLRIQVESRYSIPVPVGYKLTSLKVVDLNEDGEFKEYETYRHKQTGLYYIKVLSIPGRSSSIVDMYAKFELDQSLKDDLSVQIKPTDLKKLASKYNAIGADELSHKVNDLINRSSSMSLSQFSTFMSKTGLYTYDKEKTLYIPSFSEFSNYKKYIKNGYMFYQCSGSNNLLTDSLNYIFKIKNVNYKAYAVSGFVYDPRRPDGIYADNGHMTTYASSLSQSYSYVHLDATPWEMDPKYRNKQADHPLAEEIKKEKEARDRETSKDKSYLAPHNVGPSDFEKTYKSADVAILNSRSLRISLRQNGKDLDYSSNGRPKKTAESEQKLKQEMLAQLRKSRTSLHSILTKQNGAKNSISDEKSGLKIMSALPLFIQYLSGEIKIDQLNEELLLKYYNYSRANLNSVKKEFIEKTLAQVYSQNQHDAEAVHRYLLNNIQVDYEKSLSKANDQIKDQRNKISDYSPLLNEELQREVNNAFELLFKIPGTAVPVMSCKALFN